MQQAELARRVAAYGNLSELARVSGVPRTTIIHAIKPDGNPTLKTAQLIWCALDQLENPQPPTSAASAAQEGAA